MLTSKTNSLTCRPKGVWHLMSGIIFFVCSTSSISVLFVALRISACLAAPKRWRSGCKNKKNKTGMWQNQSPWRWTWLQLSRVPHPWTIRLRHKARGFSKHPQGNLTRGQEEIQNPTERRVLKEGWKMHTLGGLMVEVEVDRQKSGIMGVFWIWILEQSRERSDGETCCIQKFRKFRELYSWKQELAT